MNCLCKNKECKEKHYIVLQDFWLNHIKLIKGQIIHGPVSKRWIELRLIKLYYPDIENAKKAAENIVNNSERDIQLSNKNTVVINDDEVIKKSKKKKKVIKDNPDYIMEVPEKSEILLSEIILSENKL